MTTPLAQELKRIPLFAHLSDKERDFLAAHLDELAVPAGRTLISQGRGNHTFFVLRDGQVQVSLEDEPTRTLGPGDFFGEISMDQHVPATASISASTPVRVLVMSHTQFRAVKANEPLLLKLRNAMIERLLADRQSGKA